MSKFKIGDKVIRVDADGGFEDFKVGEVRTVTGVDADSFSVGDEMLYDFRAELFEGIEDIPTAEALRSRYLLSKQEAKAHSINIQNLKKEQEEIVAQLKEMGFTLYEASVNEERISFPTIVANVLQEVAYSDPSNWKEGHTLKCINDDGWCGDFVSGGIYKIKRVGNFTGIGVLNEYGKEQDIFPFLRDFEFFAPF